MYSRFNLFIKDIYHQRENNNAFAQNNRNIRRNYITNTPIYYFSNIVL